MGPPLGLALFGSTVLGTRLVCFGGCEYLRDRHSNQLWCADLSDAVASADGGDSLGGAPVSVDDAGSVATASGTVGGPAGEMFSADEPEQLRRPSVRWFAIQPETGHEAPAGEASCSDRRPRTGRTANLLTRPPPFVCLLQHASRVRS